MVMSDRLIHLGVAGVFSFFIVFLFSVICFQTRSRNSRQARKAKAVAMNARPRARHAAICAIVFMGWYLGVN